MPWHHIPHMPQSQKRQSWGPSENIKGPTMGLPHLLWAYCYPTVGLPQRWGNSFVMFTSRVNWNDRKLKKIGWGISGKHNKPCYTCEPGLSRLARAFDSQFKSCCEVVGPMLDWVGWPRCTSFLCCAMSEDNLQSYLLANAFPHNRACQTGVRVSILGGTENKSPA